MISAAIAEMTAIDWLGVLGSFLIAGAYLAATKKWLAPEKPGFNLINLAGAAFILVSLYYRPNAGAIMIEVLWVLIAVWALISWAFKRDQDPASD